MKIFKRATGENTVEEYVLKSDHDAEIEELKDRHDKSAEWMNEELDRRQAEIDRWKEFAKYLYVSSYAGIPDKYKDLFLQIKHGEGNERRK